MRKFNLMRTDHFVHFLIGIDEHLSTSYLQFLLQKH